MELHQLLQEAKERIALVSTQAELGDVRAFYLGKKSASGLHETNGISDSGRTKNFGSPDQRL